MNQQVCPNCNTPLNEDSSCPNCGYVGADPVDAAQNPDTNGTYQPEADQGNSAQGYQDQSNPVQGYQDQGYPAQGYQNMDQGYPAQGYQNMDQGYPAQGYQNMDQGYPAQGYQNMDQGYPAQGYQNMDQGYPVQGYQNMNQGYPVQGGGSQSGKQDKKVPLKKVLAFGIPGVALILVLVLLFAVIIPAIRSAPADDGSFEVGNTWSVEDQWDMTIKGVYEISDRYTEYGANSDVSDPAAVYLIDYEYTNINYYKEETGNKNINTSSDSTKLRISLPATSFIDAQGEEAFRYTYDGFIENYEGAGIGETVHTAAIVGVNHKGDLTLNMEETTDEEHRSKIHKATFYLNASSAEASTGRELKYKVLDNAVELKIGEKWTVDDQWSLTINSIKKTSERSKYSDVDYDVAAVYIIDYTYSNINYVSDYSDGLYFFFSGYATDTAGVDCEHYYLTSCTYAEFITPGNTHHCQDVIAVSKDGGFTVDALQVTDSAHDSQTYYCGFTYSD